MASLVDKVKDKVSGGGNSGAPAEHNALVATEKGHLHVKSRKTPTPGPHEVLVKVHSLGMNALDWYSRDWGICIKEYPAVWGSDIGGTVVSVGSEVDPGLTKPGARVVAFGNAFWSQAAPDYGAFQELALIPDCLITPAPAELSFNEAATLGMAVITAWTGFWNVGVPLSTKPVGDKKGMLIWGGSGSVGSAAVQIAHLLGYTVYATASPKNHEYVKKLGAARCFDYKDADVAAKVAAAAKEDGVTLALAYDAAGALQQLHEILAQTRGTEEAKIASAVTIDGNGPKTEGVKNVPVMASADEKERSELYSFIFNTWLNEKLASKEFVISSKIQLVQGGLGAIDGALDTLKAGVSATKIVVEMWGSK